MIDWALYNNNNYYDTLPMRAAVLREQDRRRRARPRLRWEDCVRHNVRKAGEEEDWQKKTRYIYEGGKDYQMRR